MDGAPSPHPKGCTDMWVMLQALIPPSITGTQNRAGQWKREQKDRKLLVWGQQQRQHLNPGFSSLWWGIISKFPAPHVPDLAVPHTGQGTLRGSQAQRGAHRHSLSCLAGGQHILILHFYSWPSTSSSPISTPHLAHPHPQFPIPNFRSSPSTFSSLVSTPDPAHPHPKFPLLTERKAACLIPAATPSSFQKSNAKKGALLSKHRNIYF